MPKALTSKKLSKSFPEDYWTNASSTTSLVYGMDDRWTCRQGRRDSFQWAARSAGFMRKLHLFSYIPKEIARLVLDENMELGTYIAIHCVGSHVRILNFCHGIIFHWFPLLIGLADDQVFSRTNSKALWRDRRFAHSWTDWSHPLLCTCYSPCAHTFHLSALILKEGSSVLIFYLQSA